LLSTIGYPVTESYPTLYPTNIGSLIDALVTAGITEITGNIVGDESRYDTERFSPTLGLGVRTTEVGPLGSLMLNDGVVLASPIKPDQPALSAAQEFLRLLTERGIVVKMRQAEGVVEDRQQPIGLPARGIFLTREKAQCNN
jgi:hypothetical protein